MEKILELLNKPMLMEPEAFNGFLQGQRTLRGVGPATGDFLFNGELVRVVAKVPTRKIHIEGQNLAVAMTGAYMTTAGGIAIVPVMGPMFKGYGSWGYADQTDLRSAVRQAANDPAVSGIMLLIDSPGGSVAGTQDLADEIKSADQQKPVFAYIEDCGCSAAYWTAASARQVYSNGGMVGSIGVVTALMDMSKMAEGMGIKVIPIVTGKYKAVGMPGTEVKPEEVAYVQDLINKTFEEFASAVSSARGMRVETVKKMEAKVFLGQDAVDNKLIDGVMSFDKAYALLGKAAGAKGSSGNTRRAKALVQIMEMES